MAELSLTAKIENAFPKMSKGQKRISEYILQNYDKAAFMTAKKLGEKVNVSESTVVRFADFLLYKGYPELQKAIQEMIRNKLTTVQLIEMAQDLKKEEVLSKVLKADVENIRSTLQNIDPVSFDNAVEGIIGASKIFIMGTRSALPLAQFFGYYLDFMLPNVRTVNTVMSDVFEQLLYISPNDVFIAVSFPRYSNRTIEGLQFAHSKGAKCIAITDSASSPLVSHADVVLTARSNMASFVDSLVAPFSLVNALIVSVGLKKKEEISQRFSELEALWGAQNTYAGSK